MPVARPLTQELLKKLFLKTLFEMRPDGRLGYRDRGDRLVLQLGGVKVSDGAFRVSGQRCVSGGWLRWQCVLNDVVPYGHLLCFWVRCSPTGPGGQRASVPKVEESGGSVNLPTGR